MFELVNNQVVIHPDKLALPYFNAIWTADKSKNKALAFKELSYIFYLIDHKSPYSSYPIDKRREYILNDIIKDSKWVESELVKEGILKYKQLNTTLSIELLESVKGLLYKLKVYFDSVEFDPTGDPEVEMKKAAAAQKSTADIGKSIESLYLLEEKVRKEITTKSTVRGGKSTALFED